MVLTDAEIRVLSLAESKPLISPFYEEEHDKVNIGMKRPPSAGLTSYGYDLRLAPELQLFPTVGKKSKGIIDPADFDHTAAHQLKVITPEVGMHLLLPPGTFALAHTIEYICMPDDLLGLLFPKSTYARTGLQINAAPIEPGWEGQITLELYNPTGMDIVLYPYSGIVQAVFIRSKRPEKTYPERSGKYQGQKGITYPRG